jgi:hypothetical protein
MEAIINGHESTAMYLVNADIDVQYNGMTVLDLAARKDMIKLTKHVILEKDVPMVFDGKHGSICHAAPCDQLEMLVFFVDHFGRDIINTSFCETDLLLHAVPCDAVEVARWLMIIILDWIRWLDMEMPIPLL